MFDNTLFKNRVIAVRTGKIRPKERMARDIEAFNVYVGQDKRTEKVMLPLWDGLTIIRRLK